MNALRLSRATCHALLMSLVEADYLYRNPDKSYVLGPALISLAVNAQNQFSPLTVARQEMRALADELDVLVSALVLEGDEVVARERAASRTHLGWAPSSPRSYPIHPWGSAFFMPLSDAELETELDKVKPPLSEKARDDVRKAVRFGRRYQFITAMSEPELKNAPSWTPQGRFVDDLPGDGVHEVRFISAPVLDQRGRVPLSLALYGFNHPMTHDEILATGERLRAVCGRIKKFMFGGALEPR